LEETGRAGNTIVLLAGDNGLAIGRHGLMGKQNMYEHSLHVPLIVSGPGIPRGQKRETFCYLLDIYPTLCDLAGVAIPGTVEGRSLVPALQGVQEGYRDTLLFAYRHLQRSVRDDRYKLIEYVVDGRRTTQLFDLQADPWETANLAGDTGCAEILERLRGELLRWRDELDDREDVFWEGYGANTPLI
jgi:arylsulfatase A-like enzyme